jgi:hypothetical protein
MSQWRAPTGLRRLGLLLAVLSVVAGCSDSPVFGETNMRETSWRVVAIGEASLGTPDVTISLDDPVVEMATLYTPCRRIAVSYIFDSDSEGVSFGHPGSAGDSCSPSDLAVDGRAANALAAAETWHLIDDTTIEMRSADGAALLQMRLESAGS